MNQDAPLSNIQLELFKLYSFNVTEEQLKDIKRMLAQYFAKQATKEMDDLWEEKGWNNDKIKEGKSSYMRTSYKPEN